MYPSRSQINSGFVFLEPYIYELAARSPGPAVVILIAQLDGDDLKNIVFHAITNKPLEAGKRETIEFILPMVNRELDDPQAAKTGNAELLSISAALYSAGMIVIVYGLPPPTGQLIANSLARVITSLRDMQAGAEE